MPPRPVGAELRDPGQSHVLGADAGAEFALDADPHAPRLLLPDRLGGEHVGDLRRADAEGDGGERPVRRGVAVAAHDERARQRQSLLGADHVHDALAGVFEPEEAKPMARGVLRERAHHPGHVRIRDRTPASAGRHVMVGDADGQGRLGHRQGTFRQLGEGVVRAFVDVMPIDEEQRRAVLPQGDLVIGPDLVEEGAGRAHDAGALSSCGSMTGAHWRAPSRSTRPSVISRRNRSGL